MGKDIRLHLGFKKMYLGIAGAPPQISELILSFPKTLKNFKVS